MITARNYAAQFEKACRIEAEFDAAADRHDDAAFRLAVAMGVASSEHFALPDCGLLLNDGLRGIEGAPICLPYPRMTVEYAQDPPISGVTKHLLLAAERDERICCMSAVGRPDGSWVLVPIEVSIPRNDSSFWVGREQISVQLQFLDPALSRDAKDGFRDTGQAIFRPLLELCEALSCRNVRAEPIDRIDPAVNARRIRDGKLPLYETKRLVIEVPQETEARKDHGGIHASPRQHLRRGHIRRLPSGNYWVNACVVGRRDDGVIDKSYEIRT